MGFRACPPGPERLGGARTRGARTSMAAAFDDEQEVDANLRAVLRDVLGLPEAQGAAFDESSPRFGALPEFDSMAVRGRLTELHEGPGVLTRDHAPAAARPE